MKIWNALWGSLVRQSARLSWKAVLLALFAFAALTAAGCYSTGNGGVGFDPTLG
jgi:4-hydroxybenzoate polyprenyltransferase